MRTLLNLNDYGTRSVLRKFGLTPQRRLGRGVFCAVYEAGAGAVWKLTSDPIQLESVRSYLKGPHFPEMLDNEGWVGTQGCRDKELSLFLFKAERLKPIREAEPATRRLARQLLRTVTDAYRATKAVDHRQSPGARALHQAARSRAVVATLNEDPSLPVGIRAAFEDLLSFMWNYDDLVLDCNWSNLMVRGTDELVLNDIICGGELLYRP